MQAKGKTDKLCISRGLEHAPLNLGLCLFHGFLFRLGRVIGCCRALRPGRILLRLGIIYHFKSIILRFQSILYFLQKYIDGLLIGLIYHGILLCLLPLCQLLCIGSTCLGLLAYQLICVLFDLDLEEQSLQLLVRHELPFSGLCFLIPLSLSLFLQLTSGLPFHDYEACSVCRFQLLIIQLTFVCSLCSGLLVLLNIFLETLILNDLDGGLKEIAPYFVKASFRRYFYLEILCKYLKLFLVQTFAVTILAKDLLCLHQNSYPLICGILKRIQLRPPLFKLL